MTETSKAPTDAEMMTRNDEHMAATALRMAVQGELNWLRRGGRSLSQAKRSALASVAVGLGMTVTAGTTKAAMVNYIQEHA